MAHYTVAVKDLEGRKKKKKEKRQKRKEKRKKERKKEKKKKRKKENGVKYRVAAQQDFGQLDLFYEIFFL